MKRSLLFLIAAVLLATACRQDARERLFEVIYPDIRFTIPAGIGGLTTWVHEVPNFQTNIDFYLSQNGVDTALIAGIQPFSARIFSLDGLDMDFLEYVEIRMCPETEDNCIRFYEVFYIDDLYRRAGETVDLLPGLRNAKPQLTEQRVRLEIIFFLRETAPYTVDGRLDMVFEAVR